MAIEYPPNAGTHQAAQPSFSTSAAFDLGDAARGDALAGGDIDGFEYSRVANPTVDALEKRLAALEDGIGAVAYLDLDDLAFLFRQVRIYFSHRCDIPSDWFSRQFPI